MTLTFPYSSAPVRQIREIQFGVMSPEEIVSCLPFTYVTVPAGAVYSHDFKAEMDGFCHGTGRADSSADLRAC